MSKLFHAYHLNHGQVMHPTKEKVVVAGTERVVIRAKLEKRPLTSEEVTELGDP